ncbi:hypothetical protein GWI33_005993 [Rhynchophorus ferrugineus]|uniref:ZN622/Rei1/Reh1 zinc finger C2H2-type domain-containing protein n=1 Tax=Rhynchophorus ferrugineus TaxID=354439 RepID=A0A834IWD8_RHYFE|nr:hypothetical protein GWI33_005993 [Rhynchophorus ferrugineus]
MSIKEDKMFGPFTLENPKLDMEAFNMETKCFLCEDSFNLKLRLDIFLRHIFNVHTCVIEDVQNIKKLPEYILYWRSRLKQTPIEQIIPSVKIDGTENQFFIFNSLLKEDKELRHRLALDYVLKVQEYERTDKNFIKQCLFCKYKNEGTRKDYLNHLSVQHNLQLDRNILKEHMRKKLHKRINPQNCEYDKFYIVNYLEVDKDWRVIEKEDDRYALPIGSTENSDEEYSDWNEKEDSITCLFCTKTETDINIMCLHMINEHNFDFISSTNDLDFYQKIKLVNYIRKMIHNRKCPYCNQIEESSDALEEHLGNFKHCIIPSTEVFNQPEFYFPTYENDTFLYLIEDLED